MPWHISTDRAECDGYAVVKETTDEVVGCHPTREEAMRHMAALYANEPKAIPYLKALAIGDAAYRVNAIPFGGPLAGDSDLQGERFTPRTDVKAGWFDQRPVLFQHGMDATLKDAVVGTQGPLVQEDDGWWAEMWLDKSAQYWELVNGLLAAGKMYGSSGALAHLVRIAPDGEILVWPHIEQTLTPTPANPYARITTAKAADAFTAAGIALPPDPWTPTLPARRRRIITTLR